MIWRETKSAGGVDGEELVRLGQLDRGTGVLQVIALGKLTGRLLIGVVDLLHVDFGHNVEARVFCHSRLLSIRSTRTGRLLFGRWLVGLLGGGKDVFWDGDTRFLRLVDGHIGRAVAIAVDDLLGLLLLGRENRDLANA